MGSELTFEVDGAVTRLADFGLIAFSRMKEASCGLLPPKLSGTINCERKCREKHSSRNSILNRGEEYTLKLPAITKMMPRVRGHKQALHEKSIASDASSEVLRRSSSLATANMDFSCKAGQTVKQEPSRAKKCKGKNLRPPKVKALRLCALA